MFISPKEAVAQGWVTGLLNPDKQIGSDGIDLTIKRASAINIHSPSVLSEDKQFTVHRMIDDIEPETADGWGDVPDGMVGFVLTEGAYDIEFNEFVKIPKGVAAMLLLRSSFVRAGHHMFSGLYDQGFENYAGSVLHICGEAFVEKNMRVAQIVFLPSEGSGKLYEGGYNFVAGDTNWQDAATRSGATHQRSVPKLADNDV